MSPEAGSAPPPVVEEFRQAGPLLTSLSEAESSAGMASDRDKMIDELRGAIETLQQENVELRDRTRRQASSIARLNGQLNSLERFNHRLSKGLDLVSDLENQFERKLGEQSKQVRELRQEFTAFREQPPVVTQIIQQSEGATTESLPRRLGDRLPSFIREPLRHTYHTSVHLLNPSNERARNYREFRAASKRQTAALKHQRALFREILESDHEESLDVIVMPIIDWHFRIQRPQHLATCLGAAGHRVFYLTTTFAPFPGHAGFNVLESPARNVFVCQLYCPDPQPVIYDCECNPEIARELARGLDILSENFQSERTASIVQHPFWRQVVERLRGSLVVYDCMDHHGGFQTGNSAQMVEEDRLFDQSDLVITTSANLQDIVSQKTPNQLIRNAAEVAHFETAPKKLAIRTKRPTVGYFGAISSWFDIELTVEMARRFSDWDFVLVGSTFECDVSEAEDLPNIQLTGEVSYDALPGYLHAFDVCIIPFQITELILCTNPVKVYEYLSAGKPVVATPMPEVLLLSEYVHIGETADEFEIKLRLAMSERNDERLAKKRADWAREQNWDERGRRLMGAIDDAYPRVSVVVLVYNNAEITKACLHSIEKFSHYPNLELIIVDNASSDGIQEYLADYEKQRPLARIDDVKIILNDANVGFAAGNNVGIRQATGDYVVLLNNDTFVTSGWVLDLVRHFREDPQIGLIGPVTNNIGNEAKISIEYASMEEMAVAAHNYTREHPRERILVSNVAFFCVALTRRVIERVGELDEEFKVGFFEDDDYCNRVREAGLRIAIAENVFVHHHLSASFSALKQERRDEIFRQNKKVYERKWGEWKPHQYRPSI